MPQILTEALTLQPIHVFCIIILKVFRMFLQNIVLMLVGDINTQTYFEYKILKLF